METTIPAIAAAMETIRQNMIVFNSGKHRELESKIAELSEEIAELQFEGKSVMQAFDKTDAAGMKKVKGEISKSEARIMELEAQEVEFTDTISREKEKFGGLNAQATDIDQNELADARLALRPQMEREAQTRILRVDNGRKISFWNLQSSISDADKLLGEGGVAEQREEWKRLRRREERQGPKRKPRAHQQER